MYLPLRVIDNEDGPLGRQADMIANAHSAVKDLLIPRIPDALRERLRKTRVNVRAAEDDSTTISGNCHTAASRITLLVPPTRPADEKAFVTEYQGVLAHEVSHDLRNRYARLETLGDAIVHEGIALHFGRMLDHGHGDFIGYTAAQTETPLLARILPRMIHDLRQRDFDYDAIFTQSPIGYQLGEQVVGLYIAGQRQEPGQLLATPTEAFFEFAERQLQRRQGVRQHFLLRYGIE